MRTLLTFLYSINNKNAGKFSILLQIVLKNKNQFNKKGLAKLFQFRIFKFNKNKKTNFYLGKMDYIIFTKKKN